MAPNDQALSEAALRYLCRIAKHMRSRSSGEFVIVLQDGGVRDYRENQSLRAADLEESDAELAREIARRI